MTATADLKAQTLVLIAELRRHYSKRLESRIFELNANLVNRVVWRFVEQGYGTYDDLYQIGAIGLVKAIRKFDHNTGNAFSSFAVPYIRGEIQHSRRQRAIKIDRRWLDAFPTIRRLRDDGATLQEMTEALNRRAGKRWSLDETQQAVAAFLRPDPDSLDKTRDDGDPWEPPANTPTPNWEDDLMFQLTRRNDGLVSATAICQHYGKRFSDYWCSRRCGKLLETLEHSRTQKKRFRPDSEPTPLYEIRKGGRQGGGESWVCDALALDILQWCDPAVHVAVLDVVVQRIAG